MTMTSLVQLFYEKAVKTLQEADAAMTSPGIGVGLRAMTFSCKRSRVATNCSAIVYKTDSIKRVFEQLPKDLNSCYEDYLYNLTLVLRNGGIKRSGIRILLKKLIVSGTIC